GLFDTNYTALHLRGKIVHEGFHALDDLDKTEGVRVRRPSEQSWNAADPEPSAAQGIQVNLEGEFNAYLRETQYLDRELKHEGRYSREAMVAALAWNHPKMAPMTELIDFVTTHQGKNQISAADLEQLYQKVLPGLTHGYSYTEREDLHDGVHPAAVFELNR
ncbi:MAG: hypothetical protein CVV27_02995, partial [Candidatus Melainabacteria bacterium HGW-Melainabacteria-1]